MSGSPLPLRQFSGLSIDWNLAPEDAVTLYLEWGNNNWHAEHPPVRSKDDVATYFVVDNWCETPRCAWCDAIPKRPWIWCPCRCRRIWNGPFWPNTAG